MNTAARLLDPGRAPAGVAGVFHRAWIDVHLGVAERLGRPRLLVLKGGGGEVERVPAKPGTANLWAADSRRLELALPAVAGVTPRRVDADQPDLAQVWRGEGAPLREIATIRSTIALALLALGEPPDSAAADDAALHSTQDLTDPVTSKQTHAFGKLIAPQN